MWICLQVLVCLSALFWQSTATRTCLDGNREAGQCVPLKNCPFLNKMIENGFKTEDDAVFFGMSQCPVVVQGASEIEMCCRLADIKNAIQTSDRLAGDEEDLLPKIPNCGKQLTNRIFGGEETGLDEFVWTALIFYKHIRTSQEKHMCGGTLISNRYVLTAAHCIPKSTHAWKMDKVRLGEWDTTTDPDFDESANGRRTVIDRYVEVPIEKIIGHHGYIGDINRVNDIALLRLSEPVVFTDYIKPVCLPTTATFGIYDVKKIKMDVVGWGATENSTASTRKLKAALVVWTLPECNNVFEEYGIVLNDQQMCAGGSAGVDSCKGDSGGPLLKEEYVGGYPYYMLAGAVSFGHANCGKDNMPGVYTRVAGHLDWIKVNIKP